MLHVLDRYIARIAVPQRCREKTISLSDTAVQQYCGLERDRQMSRHSSFGKGSPTCVQIIVCENRAAAPPTQPIRTSSVVAKPPGGIVIQPVLASHS